MGKGSSKGHTPREAKDNLKSTQLLSVIDAISEGPIEGPVDGLKSVLLNSTPVLDSEGNTNNLISLICFSLLLSNSSSSVAATSPRIWANTRLPLPFPT